MASGNAQLSRADCRFWARIGFLRPPGILPTGRRRHLVAVIGAESVGGGGRPEARHILETCLEVRRLVTWPRLLAPVEQALGGRAFAVKASRFDKHADANWTLPWHQDTTIALSARTYVHGFDNWTVKEGVRYAEAPRHVLERTLMLRFDLDDCPAERRPLAVVSGRHRTGKLFAAELTAKGRGRRGTACLARAGDVLLMRPLLVHRSGPATQPGRPRILHPEYAAVALPAALRSRYRVPFGREPARLG